MSGEDEKLLPCPFCGGEVEIYTRNVKALDGVYMNEWDIICKKKECYLSRKGKTIEQSIKAWNTRLKPTLRLPERKYYDGSKYSGQIELHKGYNQSLDEMAKSLQEQGYEVNQP